MYRFKEHTNFLDFGIAPMNINGGGRGGGVKILVIIENQLFPRNFNTIGKNYEIYDVDKKNQNMDKNRQEKIN